MGTRFDKVGSIQQTIFVLRATTWTKNVSIIMRNMRFYIMELQVTHAFNNNQKRVRNRYRLFHVHE